MSEKTKIPQYKLDQQFARLYRKSRLIYGIRIPLDLGIKKFKRTNSDGQLIKIFKENAWKSIREKS